MVAVRRHLLGGPQSRLQELVHTLTSRTKWPPAPGYLLFYGGLGVSVLALCLLAEQRQTVMRMRTFAAVLGQNSLVMFVIQAAVYYTVLHLVRPYLPAVSAWPLYMALSIGIVIAPALVWHRFGYRRFLTVGYRLWRDTRAAASERLVTA